MSQDQRRRRCPPREVKPRDGAPVKQGSPPKSGQGQAGKPKGGGSRDGSGSRRPQGKKQGGSDRSSAPKADARPVTQQPPWSGDEGAPSKERKKKSGRGRRSSRKYGRQEGQAFRGEETAADISRDIARIEKDIQIDLDSIRNQTLDL